MARKSRKRLAKAQLGCIRNLIHNIFDFRQGRSSQKLLQDKKHESKRLAAAAYPEIKLQISSESCEICKESIVADQIETSTTDAGKMSVKELMAEEMIGDQNKDHGTDPISDTKQIGAGGRAHVQKNHRRTRSMTSLNLRAGDLSAAEGSAAERPSHRRHKSLSSMYLNVMVEELCSQINHKDEEVASQVIKDPFVKEEKLWEASRVLISQFADGKSIAEDGRIQASNELIDALRIIDSNKETFLKLLQDTNSQLVKNIQNMQDVQVEEGKFKVVSKFNLIDQVTGKQQTFFWRRFKGLERNLSKKNDASEVSNRIVVLKPGLMGSRNMETTSSCGSLPESPQSLGEKDQVNRVSSGFSLTEFKRRLKHVMGKEHGAVQNGMSHQLLDQLVTLTNQEKRAGGETFPMASPSRHHFFIERIPKSPAGIKKAEKKGKLRDGSLNLETDTNTCPEERASNIYVEAQKHLAEIIGNNMVDADSPRGTAPRSLGRLMSFSGYASPTFCCPRLEGDMRLCSHEECQADGKTCQVKQDTNAGLRDPVKQELGIEPCTATDKPIVEDWVPPMEPISDGNPSESSVEKLNLGAGFPTFGVDADIVRSPDAAECQAKNNQRESSFEPDCLLSNSTSEEVDINTNSIGSEENWHSARLGQDSCSEDEASSSQVASTLSCSVTEKIEDREVMRDATAKPSPVSVLEPFVTEDEVSPPGIKCLSAALCVQPRQIHFEDDILAPSERYPHHTTCIEDDKHTIDFVKAVVQMSGLTWDELHRRTVLSHRLIDPSLLDEVDFLPDLLPCDFNLLFDLINEVVIEISWLSFGCMIPFSKPFVQPKLKDKEVFTAIWEGVSQYFELEGSPRTLDQIVSNDLTKARMWMNLQPNNETIGIQLQEAILEELVEDTILSCFPPV